jgi:hypothetical protein
MGRVCVCTVRFCDRGAAAQAGPETLLFGLFPGAKEDHVAPQRPARRARGPTVDVC